MTAQRSSPKETLPTIPGFSPVLRIGCVVTACLLGWSPSTSANAEVFDVAADFDATLSSNPDGPWTYGYLTSDSGTFTNNDFLLNNGQGGFVAYGVVAGAGGGGGNGWTSDFGFPFDGVLTVPPSVNSLAPFPGLTGDWPTAEGENADYPFGVIGGHAPNCSFCTGWYGLRWTAPQEHSGPIDLEVRVWQTALYPAVAPLGADPAFGGNTRPHQIIIQKDDGSSQTPLARGPIVPRHGWTNLTGTPQHTTQFAPIPGDPGSFFTAEDETSAAVGTSRSPTTYRLTNIGVEPGESIDVALGSYFGDNSVGFHVFDLQVRTGDDRQPTTQWDLAGDWSVLGDSSTGIGPDAAWSYGLLKGGNFAPFDKILFGQVGDDGVNPRENHSWGSNAPGWFDASAAEPETGPVVPGILKDYDGNNMTRQMMDGQLVQHLGDWSGGKVALHTPPPEVDAAQTSILRWTAAEDMTVDVDSGLWRLFLPTSEGPGNRDHEFELLHNGNSLVAPTQIDDLNFDCASGNNSICPVDLSVNGLSVLAGDTLDLLIRPVSGATGTFIGVDYSVLAALAPPGLSGDFNNDGIVSAADYTVWRNNLGGDSSVLNGNGSGAPTVVQADYDLWKASYGNTGTGAGAAIPEPASLALLTMVALGAFSPRRRPWQ